jgi:hypothetical protein
MLVSKEKRVVGVVCLCRFLLKNTKMDDGKTRTAKRRRNKTRIYVLLDIKNSKPTRTCTQSNVRSMDVVATVDYFFAMVVCFAAAFFLFLAATHSFFFERFFHPHFLLPFFISLFLSLSLSLSLSFPFFVFSRIFSFNFLPHSFRAFSLLLLMILFLFSF